MRVTSPEPSVVGSGVHRMQLSAAHEALWFESPDVQLAGTVEAFGSALLFPAAFKGRRLAFEAQPDAVWMDNVQRALAIAAEWWDYPRPIR